MTAVWLTTTQQQQRSMNTKQQLTSSSSDNKLEPWCREVFFKEGGGSSAAAAAGLSLTAHPKPPKMVFLNTSKIDLERLGWLLLDCACVGAYMFLKNRQLLEITCKVLVKS